MRLLTGIILPDEKRLNRKAIGRGERRKAQAETVGEEYNYPSLEPCFAMNCDDTCTLPYGHKGDHTWRHT